MGTRAWPAVVDENIQVIVRISPLKITGKEQIQTAILNNSIGSIQFRSARAVTGAIGRLAKTGGVSDGLGI